jgi:UDP-N-acetylglucosamine--N-acetylmuramyl-(pentapeptide) pyrophosphoryl-undecaprenol N-acetylglucosamine transferase
MKILLAGGGTAGHIEPALAVARSLRKLDPQCEFLFLGSKEGLETQIIPEAGFQLFLIPKVKVPRKLSPALFAAPFQLFKAISQTMSVLSGVDAAIGFGGYISAPLYIAAKFKKVPFLIHEQNAKPGIANRLGAYLTPHVALSYRVSSGALKKGALTGIPLRQDVLRALKDASRDWTAARTQAKKRVADKYAIDANNPLIFIFGGSQGSQAINSVIADSRRVFVNENLSVIHGVGRNNPLPERDSSYLALDYITEMADLYLASDILIARSGAVTCAEVEALARFALFIPLPIGNGEQALNAAPLVAKTRAKLINQSDFNSNWLSANLSALLEQSRNAPIAGDDHAIDAADRIAAMVEKIGRLK